VIIATDCSTISCNDHLLIIPPVHTTECAEILKLLCVVLLDDHLALECNKHTFAGMHAHLLQFASMRTIAVMLTGGAAVQSVGFYLGRLNARVMETAGKAFHRGME